MLNAIFTGLSGLNAFSQGLQTISNNVTNLNTPGFKTNVASFHDVFTYGSGLGSESGSTGNGVRFGDARVDFSQGDLRQSDGDLDLAIQGEGLLVLLHDGDAYYARTGQFEVDKAGYISLQDDSDYHLAVLDDAGRPAALNVDDQRTQPPKPTTTIKFADNLSSSATTATVADVAVFDSAGGKQVWTIKFTKASTGINEWALAITDQTGRTVGDPATLKILGSIVDPSSEKLTIKDSPPGADPLEVVLDFSGNVTSFSGGTSSTLRSASVDGHGVGALAKATIDEQGRVVLSYSNGESETLGTVALASFDDPQRLRRVSGGLFLAEGDGPSRVVGSGVEGMGRLLPKQLEASNTDLSQQFGELILVQRGFQASSQVISVTNDMIQQLFGIRGQG